MSHRQLCQLVIEVWPPDLSCFLKPSATLVNLLAFDDNASTNQPMLSDFNRLILDWNISSAFCIITFFGGIGSITSSSALMIHLTHAWIALFVLTLTIIRADAVRATDAHLTPTEPLINLCYCTYKARSPWCRRHILRCHLCDWWARWFWRRFYYTYLWTIPSANLQPC